MNLIELMKTYRISVSPGWEEGWYADLYYDSEIPLSHGYGQTPEEAVEEALRNWE